MSLAINGTDGIDFNLDDARIKLGVGDDLQLYHSGSHSLIANTTGKLKISSTANDIDLQTGQVVIRNAAADETLAYFEADGGCGLYYNNSSKLETRSNGIRVTDSGDIYIEMYSSDSSNMRGQVYADSSANMGFLKSGGAWRLMIDDSGNYTFAGSDQSDRDRKDNIATITGTSLDKITKLVPKTYTWKDLDGKTDSSRTFTGFIAQEVKEHLPSLVTGTDGQKDMAVEYKGILAHAVKAITELSAKNDALEARIATLEAE